MALDALTEVQQELLATSALGDLHIFRTLVRHPGLFRRWMPFAGKLLQGSGLSPRQRELVVLRVAWRCRSRYEWAQHVAIAREAGLSSEEIGRVAEEDVSGWAEDEAPLLVAVDELHTDHCISDGTWKRLAEHHDEKRLIEIPMLAGHYALLAGVLNSLGVQPEREDLPALGSA